MSTVNEDGRIPELPPKLREELAVRALKAAASCSTGRSGSRSPGRRER